MANKDISAKFGITEQRQMLKSVVLIHGYFKYSFYDHIVRNNPKNVFVLEGRPYLESSRGACKELVKRGIKPTVITDNMAGFLFYKNLVKDVWIGYQSTEKDGAVCLAGGLILGVLGKRHRIPVLLSKNYKKSALLADEGDILEFNGVKVAPKGTKGYVPLVELVPKQYITKIF